MNIQWEIFEDMSFYDLWAVRPVGDRDFYSPRLFHFRSEDDARRFLAAVSKAVLSAEEDS